MAEEFINITADNIESEHLCCIIRTRKEHPGAEAKRAWLRERLSEGHILRKLNVKECAFIEYAPLVSAWVPIQGDSYLYIYCLWVDGALKGHGYGQSLMEYCLDDARSRKYSGVCMLGAQKQRAWLSDQNFARRYGFETVDTAGDYELLALSFDGTVPTFSLRAKLQRIDTPELTVYWDDQCPFIPQRIGKLREYCSENAIPAKFIHVDSSEAAKALPCPFNNWAVFYNGNFVTVNQLDAAALSKIVKGHSI